jgi:hypothetical protein
MANHEFFHDVWANDELKEDVEFAMNYMRDLALESDKK